MRIFIAIPFPQHIKTLLSQQFDEQLRGADWEYPAGLHVTLRFIGNVETETYTRYKTALKAIEHPAFDLSLQGMGRFPQNPNRKPRILWAGIAPSDDLMHLQKKVSDALGAAGLPPDKHPDYNPHITIARMRTGTDAEPVSGISRKTC